MPVSKKPRRKKSNPPSAQGRSAVPSLPDRRAMEGLMSAIGGRRAEDAIAEAQQLMYGAWEQTGRRARVALAHKALGVEAGEQALGPRGFKQYAGRFWGYLETRPYMRARAGLAATLNALGEVDAAIGHYRDMLRLNPGDNQGIRYVLAACLMKRGDTEALKRLLGQYDEDGSAPWLYTRALVAFREGDLEAEELAKNAWRRNKHVPAVLAGTQKAKPSTNGYVTMGGEDEAAHYFQEWGFEWLTTPGAVDWLTKIAAEAASTTT